VPRWPTTPRRCWGARDPRSPRRRLFDRKRDRTGAVQAQVDVCLTHDAGGRLSQITAPTLVISGEFDIVQPPRFGRSVAAEIPNARFEVMPEEAHQPFQEVPDEVNARVDAFWREVQAEG
jgi:pimeloyl-ACP methyl ester carboxylesterase